MTDMAESEDATKKTGVTPFALEEEEKISIEFLHAEPRKKI